MFLLESPALASWLRRLETNHFSAIDLGLERVAAVAVNMGLIDYFQQAPVQVITVAGTNGKGSCVRTLEQLARKLGKSVGAYTSPHLLHYCERISLNEVPAEDNEVIAAFERIESAQQGISLTYFEVGTLAALDLFRLHQVEVALLEVGLGGRLDAVNIIDADVAVVTSIDIDHVDWLGSDREIIGREKAGIFRPSTPAICADKNAPRSVANYAHEIDANYYGVGTRWDWQQLAGGRWSWQGETSNGESVQVLDLPIPGLPLPSVAAALQAASLLDWQIAGIDLHDLLPTLGLTGRAQRVQFGDAELILDVAHNPASAALLAERLSQQPCNGQTIIVIGAMADKDLQGLIAPLIAVADTWYACDLPGNKRAASANQLASILAAHSQPVVEISTVELALQQLGKQVRKSDRVVVCGSFFTVAAALSCLTL